MLVVLRLGFVRRDSGMAVAWVRLAEIAHAARCGRLTTIRPNEPEAAQPPGCLNSKHRPGSCGQKGG